MLTACLGKADIGGKDDRDCPAALQETSPVLLARRQTSVGPAGHEDPSAITAGCFACLLSGSA